MTNDSHSFSAFVEKWDHEMRSKKAQKNEKDVRHCFKRSWCVFCCSLATESKVTDEYEKLTKKLKILENHSGFSWHCESYFFSFHVMCMEERCHSISLCNIVTHRLETRLYFAKKEEKRKKRVERDDINVFWESIWVNKRVNLMWIHF
jgi:hypothetical protein